jgi:hypothetical protein
LKFTGMNVVATIVGMRFHFNIPLANISRSGARC